MNPTIIAFIYIVDVVKNCPLFFCSCFTMKDYWHYAL